MFQKIFLTAFIALAISNSALAKKDCKIEQPHITFGDYFTAKKDTGNFYTISAIIRGSLCNPTVEIHNPFKLISTISVSNRLEYTNDEKAYTAVSYTFFIPMIYSSPKYSWIIKTTQDEWPATAFPAPPSYPGNQATIAVIGDMDISVCSKPFTERVKTFSHQGFDALIHLGDFAYNVRSHKGKQGDQFFKEMSKSFSTKLPYMVIAGNHESKKYNGEFFDFRFRMPGVDKSLMRGNHFYSFDYKGIHFLALDFDYIFNLNPDDISVAREWMEEDLKRANNDPSVNFIIFFSHRPFFCAKTTEDKCKVFYHLRPFEILLRKYSVDMYLGAHVHDYMRLKKQSDFVNHTGKEAENDPLVIINGVAGNNDGNRAGQGVVECELESFIEQNLAIKSTEYTEAMVDSLYLTNKSAWLKLTTTDNFITGQLIESTTEEILDQFQIARKRNRGRRESLVV